MIGGGLAIAARSRATVARPLASSQAHATQRGEITYGLAFALTTGHEVVKVAKFTGFPKQTLTFLRGIGKHNDKEWFDEHRADYEAYWLEPARALVEALGEKMRELVPGLHAEPRVGGSIFRINRDVRFSSDRRPYKEHIDLWLWEGDTRRPDASGFYVRLTPRALELAVGIRRFPAEQLSRFRAAVDDDRRGALLSRIGETLRRRGTPLRGQRYKMVPAGFAADHPRADLLRHDGLWAGPELSPLPPLVHTGRLVRTCVGHFEKALPLHRWLVDELGQPP